MPLEYTKGTTVIHICYVIGTDNFSSVGCGFRAEQHLIRDMSLLPPPYGVVQFYYERLVRPSP